MLFGQQQAVLAADQILGPLVVSDDTLEIRPFGKNGACITGDPGKVELHGFDLIVGLLHIAVCSGARDPFGLSLKLVTVWTADGRDKDGIPVRDEGSVSYNAAIESAATADTDERVSEFALRVQREAEREFDSAKRRVILGDGAKWIWNMAYELFPGAIQIVGLYHAKGTVSQAAKDIFGTDSAVGVQKAKQWRDDMEAGAINRILGDLEIFRTHIPEAATCIKYLQTNRHRMRYPDFHKQGLCTSSGVVEAGCKVSIGARLKCAGMHWSLKGANAIIALRCCRLSSRFDDYWSRRVPA